MTEEKKESGPKMLESRYGEKFSLEALAGRGFWPLKDGRIARKKRGYPKVSDITDENMSFTDFSFGDGKLAEYDWVKSFPNPYAQMRGTDFPLLAVKTDKDGLFEDFQMFQKTCASTSFRMFGGVYLELPGDEDQDSEEGVSAEEVDIDLFDREQFEREIDFVVRERYLPSNERLVGKKLPKAFDEETYADTSVVRQGYWHMSVNAVDGILESLEFSTYFSHGCPMADMFSRPRLIANHLEGMNAGLLYILDQYTEEEWRDVFGTKA